MILERIKRGLDGKFQGLNNGFHRLNKYLFNVQRSCYYLLGGMSGTFKTTLCDFIILNAIQDAESKNIPINVFYYSYEIDELTKKCNWLSMWIYKKHGKIIAPEVIKGLGDNRLTAEELALIQKELPEIEKVFAKIKFRFTPTTPTGIYHELWAHAGTVGTLLYETYEENGEAKKKIAGYKPHNDNAYNIVVIDHLYHLKKEREFGTKEVIDKFSEYCVLLRNLFGYTFFNIQQFNDGMSAVDRMKFKGVDLSPQMTDFRDSRNPYMDADVVLGTMCPYKLDMKQCLGYDVRRLKSNMIMLKIIKNRLSKDEIGYGLYVNPRAGSFHELEDPEEIDYDKYTQNG